MIELPEAAALAAQINGTLKGKRILRAVANQSPHKFAWHTGDPAEYSDRLAGKVIGEAVGVGGNVETHAGDMVLPVSAPIRYHAQGEKRPKKHQLLVEFEDGTAIHSTAQMWCQRVDDSGNLARVVTRVAGGRFSEFWLGIVARENAMTPVAPPWQAHDGPTEIHNRFENAEVLP